jgi:Ca-activated chloride channel homolog
MKKTGLLAFAVSALPILFAQDLIEQRPGLAGEQSGAGANIRVDKKLVLVPVSVLDRENRPVAGLERSSFRVFDDKAERAIESFSMEDGPVAVGLVFDTSGSMGLKLRNSRAAVQAFLATANPGDEFLLVEVSDAPELAVPLTNDPDRIETRLALAESRGTTPLLDAIYTGLNGIKKSNKSRKALLVISDGLDNHSRHTEREVQELARESDAMIYAIRIYDPLDPPDKTADVMAGRNVLKEIAEPTGGRAYTVGFVSELTDTATKVGIALRNLYVLGFSPADQRRAARHHSVQVKMVRNHGSPPVLASWRLGYEAAD